MPNANWLARFGALATEPAAIDQWHLRNTGQFGGTPGIDINVVPVWPDYTGRGVKIGIIDDGFDLTHPDLAANFKGGWDSVDGDATPAAGPDDWHGTAVAGVVGADDNGTGLLGVAHDAALYGGRISFDLVANALPALVDALGRQAAMDVSNNSWGFVVPFDDNFTQPEAAPVAQALLGAAQAGRGGLGTVWVFAAGNGRAYGDSVNHHNIQNSRYVITVGAVDASGHVDVDSTPGAALLVSAPGTSVLTTDVVGAGGYGLGDTVVETGTSLAAPMVSGVVALMLQANPGLGYRDVQEILAASARPVDVASTGWVTNAAKTWNGGGYRFSNDYGFGLVDATAAVRLAETWLATGAAAGTVQTQSVRGFAFNDVAPIPNFSSVGVTTSSGPYVSQTAARVERVELDLTLLHGDVSELVVTIISPSGTESQVLVRPGLGADGNTYLYFTADLAFTVASNAFLGESAVGSWSVRVTDLAGVASGSIAPWALRVIADDTFTMSDAAIADTYIYTNAFATLPEAARRTLADPGGTDTINASAVTATSVIDLSGVGATSIGGTALAIASGTVIENALAGDGNDTLTGNAAANILWGGRGHDTLRGQGGRDRLVGGQGNDVLDGGEGRDTADYGTAASRVVVSLASTAAQATQGAGTDTLASIEDLIGSRFNDVIWGNASDNRIELGDGNDQVYGTIGFDTLYGGAGNDTADYRNVGVAISGSLGGILKFNGGFDQLYGFENIAGTQLNDHLQGDGENNVLMGLGGDDVLLGYYGNDRLDGGDGIDLASYLGSGVPVTVYLNASSSTGPEPGSWGIDYFVSIEGFIGSGYNDTLVGNTAANILRGEGGDDRLFGLDGDDSLRGGAGYDLFYGGTGTDTADYADATVTVRAVLGTGGTVDTINFGRDWYFDIENLAGGAAKDFLTGDAHANRIAGNGGDDVIVGAGGADTLLGGLGNDQLTGGLGADIIDLGQGFDIVRYGAAAESRAGALDRIVNFTQSGGDGFDRIGFENAAGALFAGVAPTAIALGARIELASAASLAEVMAGIIGLAASGPATLALAQVKVAAGSAAGSYLVVNDQVAAFNAATDMLVAIDMTAAANLSAGNFFLF
jgi:Ca2+-binding RTX toxin-like protein/subtilisin-like proprotein convertase family protein